MTAAARLVLASTSRYRAELLRRLGVPFVQRAPDLDERAHDAAFATMTAEAFAVRLAELKAERVAAAVVDDAGVDPGAWVLAADQLAIVPGDPPELLHKPGTEARAIDQLMRLAGREHHLVTGLVLRSVETGRCLRGIDRVALHMRAFGRAEATAYVRAFAPVDCVGSYRIEDAGIRLFRGIEGSADPTAIIGLPLLIVARLLREAGELPP
jgi:septum formation protein